MVFFMSKKAIFYTVFFAVLFLLFYVGLTKIIPGYGEVKLPVLSYVQPFAFTSQDGKTITEKDIAGKVCVVEYFFTTCKGICPKMNANMKKVYQAFRIHPDFLILSHTVNPETDTVARMKRYADSLGADSKTWIFLTGTKQSLYNAARVSYLLDDAKNNNDPISNQFIHTQFFALVDKSSRVRKIYDGLKTEELEELKKDISYLLKETIDNSRFANSLYKANGN
jgi:protein SCO1/2